MNADDLTHRRPAAVAAMAHRAVAIDGMNIFYREAGPPDAPALLLLHGFPNSSHMFRNLMPALADRWRVVAPDFPGFGFSDAPDRSRFAYTFDHLADIVDKFTVALGLRRYALYVFDYGAPIGFRLALRHPEQIVAIIVQNGNAYEEGLSAGWASSRVYWAEPTAAHREALRSRLTPETNRWRYLA
ncbi:MAG: alpha/beta fold hydrolase, partial [Stellaceae bacterium]